MGARILLFATGIALLAVVAACGADRGSYVQQNERILETLPEIPGAERLRVDSSPYYLSDSGPVDGYTTNVRYEAPPGMSARDVVDFYVQSLKDDWEYCLEEIPTLRLDGAVPGQPDRLDGAEPGQPDDSILNAIFMRGGASVVVMTLYGMQGGAPHMFEIAVDHRAYRDFCTGVDLR